MKKRLILLAGLGIGFVLGSRAGRQSYERLKNQVEEFWQNPRVQEGVQQATDTVKEKAPEVAELVKDKAPEVAGKVQSAAASAASAAQAKADDVKSNVQQKMAEKDAQKAADKATEQVKKDAENAGAVEDPTVLDDTVADPSHDPIDEGGHPEG
ncbi:hypothetical protein [Brevibacterium otitidis]|uniref:YtxH domain-containing protein n=1 Tax=Brevibacterium otitidis TaxID=53364 RepID=A0ABV5X1K3_9MICO|nr:hypothetical protein GCM10023233_00580 [Brevibacterium otitidis]BFF08622.1 hypothetical protein GCM10023233_35910 [Brevibacterium otitidis]